MTFVHKLTPDTAYSTMANRWKEEGGTRRNHSATSRPLKRPEDKWLTVSCSHPFAGFPSFLPLQSRWYKL